MYLSVYPFVYKFIYPFVYPSYTHSYIYATHFHEKTADNPVGCLRFIRGIVIEISYFTFRRCLLYFVNDSLESLWIVDSEVSEHLAVDLDTSLVEHTHKNRI